MALLITIAALEDFDDYWRVEAAIYPGDSSHLSRLFQLRKSILQDEPSEVDTQWYFRDQIDMPFLQTARAAKISNALRSYGAQLCESLFPAKSMLRDRLENALSSTQELELQIKGPANFQNIRWEALRLSEDSDPLAISIKFLRSSSTSSHGDHVQLQVNDTFKVLLVTARTRGKKDIGYRTISRVMNEVFGQHSQSCRLHILRPGTFRALRQELELKGPGYYHAVHFDMHGFLLNMETYDKFSQLRNYQCTDRPEFDKEEHQAFLEFQGGLVQDLGLRTSTRELIPASTLGNLLETFGVKISILNACDSASNSSNMADKLRRCGLNHVVGMSHALSESTASYLVRILYTGLLAGQSLALSIRDLRYELFHNNERTVFYGARIKLDDWLLPIIYADQDIHITFPTSDSTRLDVLSDVETEDQLEDDLASLEKRSPFAPSKEVPSRTRYRLAPLESRSYDRISQNCKLFGRDYDILQIEQRLLEEIDSLLLRGLGGIGKSTLLRHLCAWWTETNFCDDAMYYEFASRLWSLEELLADMGGKLFANDPLFQAKKLSDQIKLVYEMCTKHRILVVIDNAEAILDPLVQETVWSREKRRAFRNFLSGFHDTGSFVLVGSRGEEKWLSTTLFEDNSYLLGGLDHEATSLLVRSILEAQNQLQYLDSDHLRVLTEVTDLLDRHPLAIKSVLGALQLYTPQKILEDLQNDSFQVSSQEDLHRCIEYSFRHLSKPSKVKIYHLAPFSTHIILEELELYSRILESSTSSSQSYEDVLPKGPEITWIQVLKQLQKIGLAASLQGMDDYVILHPNLIQYVRHVLIKDPAACPGFTLEAGSEALRIWAGQQAQPFADNIDVRAPIVMIQDLVARMDFALANYRQALHSEIQNMNLGKSVGTPLVYVLICAYFDQTVKFEASLAFNQSLRAMINQKVLQTVVFNSEILHQIAKIYQNIQDRKAALTTLADMLSVVTSHPIRLQSKAKLGQRVPEDMVRLAHARSKCFEQLSNISISSGKTRLGIKCQIASIAWRRTTAFERTIIRGLERFPVDFLARIFLVLKDDASAERYQYGSIIRAIELSLWPEVVNTMVVNRKIDEFPDDDLPLLEDLLQTTRRFLSLGPNSYDIPAIDIFLLDVAIRKSDEISLLRYAKSALGFLKKFQNDYREFALYMKLGKWYESQQNVAEARDSWLRAYTSVKDSSDLGGLVSQETALAHLISMEEKLNHADEAKRYTSILNERFSVSESIARREVDEKDGEKVTYVGQANNDFWESLAEQVENDLYILKNTIDVFELELKEDREKIENALKDKKGFFAWLDLQMQQAIAAMSHRLAPYVRQFGRAYQFFRINQVFDETLRARLDHTLDAVIFSVDCGFVVEEIDFPVMKVDVDYSTEEHVRPPLMYSSGVRKRQRPKFTSVLSREKTQRCSGDGVLSSGRQSLWPRSRISGHVFKQPEPEALTLTSHVQLLEQRRVQRKQDVVIIIGADDRFVFTVGVQTTSFD